jgi:hypothetical protein
MDAHETNTDELIEAHAADDFAHLVEGEFFHVVRGCDELWGRMASCAPMASALFEQDCSSATGRLTTGRRMPSCPTVGVRGY